MKYVLGFALALGVANAAAMAQTVYEPVRYQYGQYGEVFYGGTNPAIASNDYVYVPSSLPQGLQAAYAARRMNATTYPYPQPYMLSGSGEGAPFYSPYTQGGMNVQTNVPYIFSDYLPGEEVSQFGFTVNDARNEAYSHVPLYQVGGGAAKAPAKSAAPMAKAKASVVSDSRAKAVPLLNWAKVEREQNPPLYQALLQEARKYDPAAVEKFEKD